MCRRENNQPALWPRGTLTCRGRSVHCSSPRHSNADAAALQHASIDASRTGGSGPAAAAGHQAVQAAVMRAPLPRSAWRGNRHNSRGIA
eukprot:366001-Chlamydomonas_euryale.AAC.14